MGLELSKQHCSLSDPSPTYSATSSKVGCPTLVNTYGSTPYNVTGAPKQRNMAQMKEQIKIPEKELSDERWTTCQMQSSKRW